MLMLGVELARGKMGVSFADTPPLFSHVTRIQDRYKHRTEVDGRMAEVEIIDIGNTALLPGASVDEYLECVAGTVVKVWLLLADRNLPY